MSDEGLAQQSQRIRQWLLFILRFAITREQADRAAVLAMADHLDRPSATHTRRGFSFFARTSAEICSLIDSKRGLEENARLRLQLRRIDDVRLRRALESVLEIERADSKVRGARLRQSLELWRGLPVRH